MKLRLLTVLAIVVACFGAPQASAAPAFACPPELASLDFPEPRMCLGTQGWWVEGRTNLAVPAADFPLVSTHVHGTIPFPVGERLVIPASGGHSWPYLAESFNGFGGTIRQVRGGQFQFGSCCTKDPNVANRPIPSMNYRFAGSIPIPSSIVSSWRSFVGKRENRFTVDTTSPFADRQYNSGAWNAFLNATAAPVGITGRGWYEGPGYTNIVLKDSNIGTGTGFRASVLQSTCAPSSVTIPYGLREGAIWAFAYLDPDLHANSKGIVIMENRTGSDSSFTFSTVGLTPGTHFLLVGGWEKSSTGWNAGVTRLPFRSC